MATRAGSDKLWNNDAAGATADAPTARIGSIGIDVIDILRCYTKGGQIVSVRAASRSTPLNAPMSGCGDWRAATAVLFRGAGRGSWPSGLLLLRAISRRC